ncbi:unnamed protein product [Ixodes pacificus]
MDVDIRTATPDDLAWTAAIGVSGLILLLFVIFRFGRDSMLTGSSVTYVAQTKDQQHMVKVENPFSIAVENRGSASLSDGIDLVVSSTCQFKMRCYWGLNCSAYHRCNELRWIDLFEGGVDGTLWSQHTLEQGELFQSDSCEGLRFRAVPCAPIESSKLGNSPRQRLPLVVVMMRDGVSSNCEDTQVVSVGTLGKFSQFQLSPQWSRMEAVRISSQASNSASLNFVLTTFMAAFGALKSNCVVYV